MGTLVVTSAKYRKVLEERVEERVGDTWRRREGGSEITRHFESTSSTP